MYLGPNLQYLRRQNGNITQEKLADRLGVSRQTISKWESGESVPELSKLMELCSVFSCTLDTLLREDLTRHSEEPSVRIVRVAPFRYAAYTVISKFPEEDAIRYLVGWASRQGLEAARFIHWGFPYLSQEQKHRFRLRGSTSALILPTDFDTDIPGMDYGFQEQADYAVLRLQGDTAPSPGEISRAYGAIMAYLNANGIRKMHSEGALPCFQMCRKQEGKTLTDIYVHCQSSENRHPITRILDTQEEKTWERL